MNCTEKKILDGGNIQVRWEFLNKNNEWKGLNNEHSRLCETFHNLEMGKFKSYDETCIFDTKKMIMRKKKSKNLYDTHIIRRLEESVKV